MVRVLFVCLGNICRSPMAEAVFRKQVEEAGLKDQISIDSAGTGHWHIGKPPHEGTRSLLDRYDVDYAGLKARQVKEEDVTRFDYILAMDADNLSQLHALAGRQTTGEIARLLDFVPDSNVADVPDPYFTGNFDEVYELVNEACSRLLTYICDREQL
ncbi:low molecular weight protein-tyrosine-phosphatase [Desertibacillus haloalkaliphilus]|uniref:low molecular weight protein-tyrosine-phosphatase n=1 Tax=Desertibacillus haloalkaliphilus TaxID=1328930 RepID=UPI001C2554E1|nr:low molecular weight protein-tyrosine-phosphatase [Desertibacillus haloalkaliphilus]MBU8907836.1 low molecular weight phosphotyrosine protein phosphatase [Desertibacillus haloalkaliphilus]